MPSKPLSIRDIKSRFAKVAKDYPITRASVFGSYAEGRQTTNSDIDLLVEFDDAISIYTLARLKLKMEESTGRNVDIVPTPIPAESFVRIRKEVPIYG